MCDDGRVTSQKDRAMILSLDSTVISDSVRPGRILSLWIAAASVLRGLPLLLAVRPQTPLRVMCIMAFDTLYRLRTSRKLPIERVRLLAALLDYGACANAVCDRKPSHLQEIQTTQRLLDDTGFRPSAEEYWRRIQNIERQRPGAGGQPMQFSIARAYREEVVELSLGVLTTAAFGLESVDDGIQVVRTESDLAIVFRIVMQCQVIDDVVDYSKDTAAGLPSFLTSSESLPQAFELTAQVSRSYSDLKNVARCAHALPFRIALVVVSVITKLVMTLARWRLALALSELQPEPTFGP